MVPPETVSLWFREQAWPLGILLLLVGVAVLILKLSASHRAAVLSRERSGLTEQIFAAHLEQYGFDPTITGSTYRYLQEICGVRFPIVPSDRLDEDLGMDTDEVEETIVELLQSLGRENKPGLRYEPILTVEGLVRHLQASPRKRQQAAA